MMEAVHRYEGTVNQVMGDGIMALFGAPVAHEDHAVRACYAAHDMQAAMRRHTEEMRRAHGIDVQVRVGLNSGEVVVRAIGSDLRMDYSAVGQTTHLAGRMEQLARPGVTLLTADTLRLAEGYVEVKPLGPVPLKGLADPVEVYELAGLGLVRSRLGAAAARGLTRFIGRDSELEQLRQTLGYAGAGHGQVVAIVGEPGVGKSRLVWEVTHSHRTHGWLVIHASSVSYGKATPYLPVIDLLSDPAHLARRRRPPAPHPRLLDLWPRGRADALPRRRSPAARLAPTADAPHPRLVRLHDGVSAGAGRRRLAAARAHLGARSDREPAPAVWAGGATLTARGDSAPPATTACRGYPRGRGTARWHGHLVHAVVTLVGQP